MQRKIQFGVNSRKKIQDGINKVADAVCVTLGPKGRNVIISKSAPNMQVGGMQYFQPIVTKDGVTVARNIMLDDFEENVGCLIIREAAEKTMQLAGDGTTTTCLFVQAIVNEGIKLLEQGINPQELKAGIDKAVEHVVSELKKMAIPIGDDIEKIRQIATVSANNDSSIGDLIAEAFDKIGHDGDVSIEESKSTKTEIKITAGYKFPKGYTSPHFITNFARNECELENPYILIYEKKLYQLKPLENLLNLVMHEGRPILVICDGSDGEAHAAIVMNTKNPNVNFKACIVGAPSFGEGRLDEMEDIALLTGGVYISEEKGLSLEKTGLKQLGGADKVIISNGETIIIGGGGNKEAIDEFIGDLKMNLVDAKDDVMAKEKIEKRISKLTGGIAVIYVGAPTETEMKERKDRVDDSIRATKAAIAEGFVAGGGSAFLGIKTGNALIDKILREPFNQICKNAGFEPFELKNGLGFNAKTGVAENLIESGIVDPVKVLRCSLEHAASAAGMILTSECLIVDTL